MGSKPKTPAPPDTVGAAKAEAQGNKEVAQITAGYNRPTQIDPYGMTTWQFRPSGGGTVDPALQGRVTAAQQALQAAQSKQLQPRDGYGAAQRDAEIRNAQANYDAAVRAMNTSSMGTPDNPRPGDWQQITTLTPEQQAILEAQQQNDLLLQQLATKGIGIAQDQLSSPFDTSQLPQLAGIRDLGPSNVGIPGQTFSQVGYAQNRLNDMARLNEDPNQFAAQRKEVSDALYRELTKYSDERFGREEAAERTRLSNMGFQQGTEAYDAALREFTRGKNESYSSAADRAVLAGGQEQSRMLADLLAARASNIGLGQSQFGMDMDRYNQELAERQFQFDTGTNRYQMDLGERQAQLQSDLSRAGLQASNRQQLFNEAAYKRGLPLSEITQLMGGAAPQMPQFQPFQPMQAWQGPQLLDAELGRYNAALGSANAQNAARGQTMATLGKLGGAAIGSFMGPIGTAAGGYIGGLLGGS